MNDVIYVHPACNFRQVANLAQRINGTTESAQTVSGRFIVVIHTNDKLTHLQALSKKLRTIRQNFGGVA